MICPTPVDRWAAEQHPRNFGSDIIQAAVTLGHTRDEGCCVAPMPAVSAAWASSLHQIEEGDLTWPNATQWAINRLSASQVALAHSQTSGTRKTCKYYNEGSCSHDTHHGSSGHFCSFCSRQGKNLTHPESKCNTKQGGRQQQSNI